MPVVRYAFSNSHSCQDTTRYYAWKEFESYKAWYYYYFPIEMKAAEVEKSQTEDRVSLQPTLVWKMGA